MLSDLKITSLNKSARSKFFKDILDTTAEMCQSNWQFYNERSINQKKHENNRKTI